jgi:hypothetical protein
MLGSGRWHLRVDHSNSECTQAGRMVVLRGGSWRDRLVDAPLAAGARGGTADAAFTLQHAERVDIIIAAEGGLECWGETTITAVWLDRGNTPLVVASRAGDAWRMSELAKLGVEVTQQARGENTELVFTLPRALDVRASFAPESLATKVRKVFKHEIQVGDAIFDDAVNIRTDTEKATVALLEQEDVRAAIESLVVNNGVLELDGKQAKVELPGKHGSDNELAMNIVRVLVAAT